MSNLALGKRVKENILRSSAATDGNTIDYDAKKGYAHFRWPGTLTVDLEEVRNIHIIRFLLWDGLGNGSTKKANRKYSYRLLVSIDYRTWGVVFDTGYEGYTGWQCFNFPNGIDVQFIRITGLRNTANNEFHIVQVEAYKEEAPKLDKECALQRTYIERDSDLEIGDGYPLSRRVDEIVNQLELINTKEFLHPDLFTKLTAELKLQVLDIGRIENNMDSIRREIIEPVKKELEISKKLGRFSFWGFWVGIVGGILAILTLAIAFLFK